MSIIDWSILYDMSLDVNEMYLLFHSVFHDAIVNNIPKESVVCTPRDKPWITPFIKSLINKRWQAYRTHNFILYNHYKHKVKHEIDKARLSFASKINKQGSKLWDSVSMVTVQIIQILWLNCIPVLILLLMLLIL